MRLTFLLALVLSTLPGLATAECSEVLDREFRPLAGKEPESLCGYQGQVLLIVNTASKCGLTPQYEGLEALHERLQPRGFTVLGFPSNDFLGQEPGTEDQIREFCTLTYGVKFPMFQKTRVKGDNADPFYKLLAQQTGQAPGWNFHKYLINRKGEVVASFGSRTPPDNEELLAKIEALLAEPAADTSADASQ